MKGIYRKLICMTLIFVLCIAGAGGAAYGAAGYTDVPENSWAKDAIKQASDLGLMKGNGDGSFGYGKPVTKAEFVTILCNMQKWTMTIPEEQSFSDVNSTAWYFNAVETALNYQVMDQTQTFSPNAPIARGQMAEMLVRALGLSGAAAMAEKNAVPFTDITTGKGYIALAYEIGMITGKTATTFAPDDTATREEAAAMLTRVYTKYYGDVAFQNGFYAISSYSQKDLTAKMDAVTFGWSRMTLDDKGVWLNTGSENNNEYKIPAGYEDVISYVNSNGTKAHLGVYMDSTGNVATLLTSAENRSAAIKGIMEELTKTYDKLGKNPYSGVTIDFEGLKGNDVKQGLNAFLTDLASQLKAQGKTLYVAVQPALADGVYFDGFDYKTIGQLADKVILMAHDYQPVNLNSQVGTEWHKNAAITPIGQVYYSLKAITDPATGVQDKSKILLAISFNAVGWQLDDAGKLLSGTPVKGDSAAVENYLSAAGTVKDFSDTYRNPYITYKTQEGKNIFLWYEDQQSVFEKAALARLLGIDGISIWRLGNIPTYTDYDVRTALGL